MAYVEQAIFTSAQTDRSAGYQVVATSPGVVEADRRELAVWGPSHDSLLEQGPDAVSLNFFPLPSGAFCISRTTPAGWEYSGRGGHRVYTHCLVVPPDVLERFANHPVALVRAAVAAGAMETQSKPRSVLEPLELPGSAPAVDQSSLARLAQQLGPAPLAMLLQTALSSFCLAIDGTVSIEHLVAGLLDCLPPECRTAMWFSTGLKYSSRRPFRIVSLPHDPAARRWLTHQPDVCVLDLSEEPSQSHMALDSWTRLIERSLASGQIPFLAAELAKPRPGFTQEDLPALGLQLLEDVDASTFYEEGDSPVRAHKAHQRFVKSAASATVAPATVALPSKQLKPDSPEVIEKLETLDDSVYDAINGQVAAMQRLAALWPTMRSELGEELLADSREQYLRYALTIWEQCVDQDNVRDPSRAVSALEVLCVLFDEA